MTKKPGGTASQPPSVLPRPLSPWRSRLRMATHERREGSRDTYACVCATALLVLLLVGTGPSRELLAQCTIPENCSGDLSVGACGYTDGVCKPPPGAMGCQGNGVGQCAGTYNCQPPTASPQGVQLLGGGGGTYTARLSVDVVAPFNGWATTNNPNGALNVFWYAAAAVPDICNSSVPMSLCSLADAQQVGDHFGTDHGLVWLDETGLTCGGAPYDFFVSALFFTCAQPSCQCEMFGGGNPNCICFANTATPLNGLEIKVTKAMIPGCVPPPAFCAEGGGAGGGSGGAGGGAGGGFGGGPLGAGGGGTGGAMAWTGSKGNGPDSGAAGTTGGGGAGGGGSCTPPCKSLGSSSGDGSGCGANLGGGGSSCTFKAAGAHFRYGAGGAGGPGWPGSSGVTANPWNTTLGRYWSHDYAERIVMDPDETHVWLLTRFGSFREFGSLAAGSGLRLYQTVTPSDEYRKLYYNSTTQSWQLQGLDGSVESFLGKTAGSPAGTLAGFFDKVTDRLYDPANPAAHPPVQAAYNVSNQLDHVTFPDGRQETFAYSGGTSGKLASLTEVGTDGTTARSWTFTWSGDDLVAIGRPDLCPGLGAGTAWKFFYGDSNHPGYLTQVMLMDCHNNGRIEAAFQYDSFGNVILAWRGDPFFTGPNATDAFQLSFDSAALPAVTTVQTLIKRTVVSGTNQDTLQTGIYTLDRDPGRAGASGTVKARVRQIAGECPSCGTVASPAFTYGDPGNPLLPTAVTDGKGVTTRFTYDPNGRQLTRIETVQTTPALVQRQTSWTYNSTFPSFVSTVTGPFSPPGTPPAGTRSTSLVYDAKGNLLTSTSTGSETTYPTGAFSLQTAYGSYSAAGLPGLINPPDTPSTTNDATTYTFKTGVTNGFLVATRKDPVIGAAPINAVTSFQYDPLNRPTDATDPNGMTTHTAYDELNRVLTMTQGFGGSQPLTTTYNYNALGDLVCAQLPAGNALAYGYDFAGRLTSIARQAGCAATQPLEQTLYTLDAAGHRIRELRQRLVSGSPVTDATTSYAYTTACHLDSMTAGDPNNPGAQSTTQFAYDCDNNLISLWDPNHNQPAAPSTSYSYDLLNRLTQVIQPWGGAGGGNAVTSYVYDLQDHLASVTDSERNQTTYITSDRDLLTRQTSPVTGVTTYAYNAHGALVQQTDARGMVMTRQLDPADRPISVTYSNDSLLTTTYAYDTTTAVGTSPIGRLSSITKGSGASAAVVSYTYDLFGRTLQDGALNYAYDLNGNRVAIAYPGNVTACYGYDLADRQAALSYSTASGANVCQGTTTPIITSTPAAPTVYSASGPLQVLHLANGVAETHTFDQRFYPNAISAGSLLSWTYATDAAGNITSISPGRTFAYQDFQYFLIQANAPTLWGTRTWAYDTIGNRLSEDRGSGAKDTYTYLANGASPQGHTPLLKTIALANNAGTKYLTYDFAGNLIQEASPTSQLDFTADAAGKLSRMTEETQRTSSTLVYDGRGFLSSARGSVTDCGPMVTTPTYGSDGLLYHRQQKAIFTGTIRTQTRIFYFAGRPVAQLEGPPATGTLTYLTVDHLGTPILASTSAATATWSGGFEPFGRDFTTPSAQSSGIFLRLPGQWDDSVWDNSKLGSGLYYNLNRWYDPQTSRYTQADRFLPPTWKNPNLFSYSRQRPTALADPLGLFIVDPSCDCSPTPPDNIYQAIGKARQYPFSPKCQAILEKYRVLGCVANRFGPAEIGKEPVIKCQKNPPQSDACGETTNPFGGIPKTIHLYPGTPSCPRYKPGFGLAVTLFHETVHSCGNYDEQTVIDITEVCTGW
jgi:RHS repeat-associated protein